MDKYLEIAAAYALLRETIDAIVVKLGGSAFARAVVTTSARELFRDEGDWRHSRHMVFCEALTANAADLRGVAVAVERRFVISEAAASHRCPLEAGGALVIRGERLYFETERAATLLVHAYEESMTYSRRGDAEPPRWTIGVAKEAEAYLDFAGMKKPSVGIIHVKSRDGAIKGMIRIAKEHFGADMKPVTAPVAA